jgi:DNA repair photolyase
VRWASQQVEEDAAGRLPGYSDAVVRRFDAPEALDTRFYEVHAKSALNHVPQRSRVPFSWTVNPYRGCSHACTYCQEGDTPILLADGRVRALADVRAGDSIYGTVRRGSYRRFVETDVLAHWSTVKPAYRVRLEDGTELVASGDHRFLTGRGWKHVTGRDQGRERRPHLTLGCSLMGTGAFAAAPDHSVDYRRGYLCGLIRGDGHVGSYVYELPHRTSRLHRFRLALTDLEALHRAHRFLADAGIATDELVFTAAGGNHRETRAIRTQSRSSVEAIRSAIEWPGRASEDWCKGFLAGIFDAEGSFGQCIRIANTDSAIIDWTTWSLRRLGLEYVVERPRNPDGPANVRLRGGLPENLRFFHAVDPAITRKRTIEGRALKFESRLKVVEIEPLGMEIPMYDITTGTGDFIADGVVSHNCFARPTHEYLDFNAGRDFEREIVVKVNVPEVLRAELARRSWTREHVALGTNTDPYQWVEGRYKLMRGIWAAFRDAANPCSVLTKSPLLLRDVDLMKEIAAVADFSACLSVPTLDEKAWRATEPHTPNPRARLEAVAELNRQGIPTGILIAPLMPGINDAPGQVERIIALADAAGATSIGGQTLFLAGSVREIFFDWLRTKRPDLVERYEHLYRRGAYIPVPERRVIEQRAGLRRRSTAEAAARFRRGAPAEAPASGAPPAPPPRQEALF